MALRLTAVVAARHLEVDVRIEDGQRVALLGPNGAGKSTVLALIAGTLRPDSGRAELDGQVLFDVPPSGRGQWRSPWQRGVALLPQDPLLFPHLTAVDNVAFGPRARRRRRSAARAQALTWLARVDAAELAERRPAQLSGGQAQRVAVARALAAGPHLLLLDEPMAALDVAAAPGLRRLLRHVLADRSAIVVTHDVLDAVLLTHRVIVLEHGRVVEDGPTESVLRHPRSAFTARLAGLNLVRGTATGDVLQAAGGQTIAGVPRTAMAAGEPAVAVFSPTAVTVFTEAPHGSSARNTLTVVITELEPRDHQVRVRADTHTGLNLAADVTAATVADLDLYPGRPVSYAIKATAVTIYPG